MSETATSQCDLCEDAPAIDEGIITVDGMPLGPPVEMCSGCEEEIEE